MCTIAKRFKLWQDHGENRTIWEVQLRCDDGTVVPASRSDLAAASEYFERQFLGGFSDSNNVEIELKGVCGQSLKAIVASLYSQDQLRLTTDSVGDVVAVADKLLFDDVKQQCKDFLVNRVTCATAISFLEIAERCNLTDVAERIHKYVGEHLKEVLLDASGAADFARLHPTDVAQLLKHCNKDLRYGTELLELYAKLAVTGVKEEHILDLIDLQRCTLPQLRAICEHPFAQHNSNFLLALARETFRHQQELRTGSWLPTSNHVKVNSLTYILKVCWRIPNWSQKSLLDSIDSPAFHISNKGTWVLRLYPLGIDDGVTSKHLSLFLCKLSSSPEEVNLRARLFLLDQSNFNILIHRSGPQHFKHSIGDRVYSNKSPLHGQTQFFPLDKLTRECDRWMKNDTLVFGLSYIIKD